MANMDGNKENHWFEVDIPEGFNEETVLQTLRSLLEKVLDCKIDVYFERQKFFIIRISKEDSVCIYQKEDFDKTFHSNRIKSLNFGMLVKMFVNLAKEISNARSYKRNQVKCHMKGVKPVPDKTEKTAPARFRLSDSIVPTSCTVEKTLSSCNPVPEKISPCMEYPKNTCQVIPQTSETSIAYEIESEKIVIKFEIQEPKKEKLPYDTATDSPEEAVDIQGNESVLCPIHEVCPTQKQAELQSKNNSLTTSQQPKESGQKLTVILQKGSDKKQERSEQLKELHTKYWKKRREAECKRKKKSCKLGIGKLWKKRKKRKYFGRFKRKLKDKRPKKKKKWKNESFQEKNSWWNSYEYLKQTLVINDNTSLNRNYRYSKETISLLRDLTTPLHYERFWIVSVFVYPTRRGKHNKGNRRNQQGRASSSQGAEGGKDKRPIQVSDASNENLDLPPGEIVVTSTRSIFNTFSSSLSSPTPSSTVSVDSERNLRTRLRRELPDNRFSRIQQPPKHPVYADQRARQRSFSKWPATTGQDPTRMAIYGFFHTGRLDLIRCFHCGIGLKDWTGADEPLFEHIKHSPDCSFLRDLLGQDLLSAYRDNLQANQSQQSSNTASSASGNESGTAARVRNPQFKEHSARLRSFEKWPVSAKQGPQKLADAGLFYTGTNDLCRCFTCDGGLQRWDEDDDPWIEHARWFPQCQYVRQIKGQEYINMVQQAAAQAQAEEEDTEVTIPPPGMGAGRSGPVEQGMADLNLADSSPLNTYVARRVMGLGYSRRAVLIAIDEYKCQAAAGAENDFSTTDLVRILTDRERRGEALPPDDPMDSYLGATAAVLLPENLDPEEENRQLRGIIKCMVCQENDTNILFIPCTHHRMCEECAEKVQICPVCGKKISEKIKTYLS